MTTGGRNRPTFVFDSPLSALTRMRSPTTSSCLLPRFIAAAGYGALRDPASRSCILEPVAFAGRGEARGARAPDPPSEREEAVAAVRELERAGDGVEHERLVDDLQADERGDARDRVRADRFAAGADDVDAEHDALRPPLAGRERQRDRWRPLQVAGDRAQRARGRVHDVVERAADREAVVVGAR